MRSDPVKTAEAFIDKVIAPQRLRKTADAKAAKAKVQLVQKDLDLGRAVLAGGGLDLDGLDKLAAERSKERVKLAEDSRRKAVAASASVAARLRSMPIVLPYEPMEFVIDQVTFIRTFAGQGSLAEWNVAPGDNWARYEVNSTSDLWDGTGRLSFFILWKNPRNSAIVMTATPTLIINAHLSCDADWAGVASWFGMESTASAKVGLRTTVWGMDSSVKSIVFQQDEIAHVSVNGGFFGDDSSTSVEFNENLGGSGVIVPGQTFVLIEVEVLTDWHASGDASAKFDAQSGSHRIDLPQLIVRTDDLEPPPPPISISASVNYATNPPTVMLTWSGATTPTVDIYRNGVPGTFTNDGAANFSLGSGTYTFRVCEAGSSICSGNATVTVT